jgi:hypothetical protein
MSQTVGKVPGVGTIGGFDERGALKKAAETDAGASSDGARIELAAKGMVCLAGLVAWTLKL